MEELPAIVRVIRAYYPAWVPPRGKSKWLKTACPFHDESNPSASVSFELEAFKCHGCGVGGSVVTLIMRKEGIKRAEAVRRAEEILGGSYVALPQKPARKPRRRAFGDSGADVPNSSLRGREVPPWLRE